MEGVVMLASTNRQDILDQVKRNIKSSLEPVTKVERKALNHSEPETNVAHRAEKKM